MNRSQSPTPMRIILTTKTDESVEGYPTTLRPTIKIHHGLVVVVVLMSVFTGKLRFYENKQNLKK